MKHCRLIKHKDQHIRAIWSTSAANETGRLFQGVVERDWDSQRAKGNCTFSSSNTITLLKNKAIEVEHARIVCTMKEIKKGKHKARTTTGGSIIKCQGDAGTPTAHLEITKLLFNSISSRKIPNL